MNEFVGLAGAPALMRNSLILIGLTFRTFSAAVSDCFAPLASVHERVADQVAVEGRRPRGDLEGRAHARTRRDRVGDRHRRPVRARNDGGPSCWARTMLNSTPVTGAPVVFVNVTVVSCEDPGENVWSPGGAAVADAGARLSRATSYLAATTLACTI